MALDHLRMTYQFTCRASELEVRSLMAQLGSALRESALEDDLQSSVEIAVTEALNNIVEHACAGISDALIRIDLTIKAAHVIVHLQDPGAALPGCRIPQARALDLAVGRDDLPEGGFGWGLIHALTDQLEYSRSEGANRLRMRFARGSSVL